MSTVAVLLRSDAAFVGIHVGEDWQDAAQRLSLGHCFDMTVPVVFPAAPPDAVEAMKSILAPCLIRNGWYICSVADVCVALLNAMAAPEARGNKRKLAETEEEEEEEEAEEEAEEEDQAVTTTYVCQATANGYFPDFVPLSEATRFVVTEPSEPSCQNFPVVDSNGTAISTSPVVISTSSSES